MNTEQLRQLIREIAGKGILPTYVAKVDSVGGGVCSVTRVADAMTLDGVRLNASGDDSVGLVLTPKTGSHVLVSSIDGVSWFVCQCSELESVTFNGGTLGGLVKIQELTDRLNQLVEAFNSHTHTVSTTGSASAQTGTAAAIINRVSRFDKSDYENEKIKQ